MTAQKFIVIACIAFVSCKNNEQDDAAKHLQTFADYFKAVKDKSDDKWNYTTDTVRLWFDSIAGDPALQVKGQASTGKWKDWDKEMHASSYYDTTWYDKEQNAVKGYFYEDNDFYELIGKGPTKTLRTYWLNDRDKIKQILIYWIPEENTTTSVHLKPIVEWAMENDSTEIKELYPEGKIVTSTQNAIRWKKLLTKYYEAVKQD